MLNHSIRVFIKNSKVYKRRSTYIFTVLFSTICKLHFQNTLLYFPLENRKLHNFHMSVRKLLPFTICYIRKKLLFKCTTVLL